MSPVTLLLVIQNSIDEEIKERINGFGLYQFVSFECPSCKYVLYGP